MNSPQLNPKIFELLNLEDKRQQETISLIPSENYASQAVRDLVGSRLVNKYSEGYPGKRYYQGNKNIDDIENLAIDGAKKLFGTPHANVQPYSGSPANTAVLFALCAPGDTIMGMELSSGGHLTHGHPKITFSGKYFKSVQYGITGGDSLIGIDAVQQDSSSALISPLIDYDAVKRLALEHNPKVIIAGTTAYPFFIDWQRFAEIASSVGAYLLADISHVSGLIVSGVYPSPVKYAHIVTTTTHKTLRGPRGAIIMVTDHGVEKDNELPTKIDRAVFPGLQGGPHDNTTAAIAQCLFEADTDEFKTYGKKVVENAKVLADELKSLEINLIGGGTDSHLMLVDLKNFGLSGNVVAEALEIAGIVVNRNSIPGDTSPFYPSGIRVGTPAATTRGMGEGEMKQIAEWISKVIDHAKEEKLPIDSKEKAKYIKDFIIRCQKDEFLLSITKEVKDMCARFPIP